MYEDPDPTTGADDGKHGGGGNDDGRDTDYIGTHRK